ncbi:MAG: site-specific DNA-methyltransferase [Micrococcaceae bacterium]
MSEVYPIQFREQQRFGVPEGVSADNVWINKLIYGDNLKVLQKLIGLKQAGLLKNGDGSDGVRLIYIDPPFATGKKFESLKTKHKAYQDKLTGKDYLEWFRKRLVLLKDLLAEDGSIYVHLDYRKSHYVKVLMDEIFDENNFVNEIIWHYYSGGGSKKQFSKKHDTILLYQKSNKRTFNLQYEKKYVLGKKVGIEKLKKADREWLEDENGVYTHILMRDTWYIPIINPLNKQERVNYPTQKPEALLERVIKASSNEGDIVLDCFGGSGTTAAVAEKLKRRWISCDIGELSIKTQQKRLLNLKDNETKTSIEAAPFILYNLNF